jgi:hypothetical protein
VRLQELQVIYLIKCGEFHKIGFTGGRKVEPRLQSMQTATPYKLEVVGFWHGTENDEAALHATFAERRVRGEWFSLTAEDVERLRALMDAKPVEVELPPPPRANPPNPMCLPDVKFADGARFEVDYPVGCGWCGRQLWFVGSINYLVCEPCDHKIPMGQIVCNTERRKAVEAAMLANAV